MLTSNWGFTVIKIAVLISSRNCKFPEEVNNEDSLFKTYSQSSCEYECRVEQARNECHCTPWNVPTPPRLTNPAICDIYGNHCFGQIMINATVIKYCTQICLPDCEDIRFSINEKEIPIDINYQCGTEFDSGAEGLDLVYNLLKQYCHQYESQILIHKHFPFLWIGCSQRTFIEISYSSGFL